MTKEQDLWAYFLLNQGRSARMSRARLVLLHYLADWFFALKNSDTITGADWRFDHRGPFLPDASSLQNSVASKFRLITSNLHGRPMQEMTFTGSSGDISLSKDELKILEVVDKRTRGLYFGDIVELVYSTHPISRTTRNHRLDLPEAALDFHKVQEARKVQKETSPE